MKLYSEKEKDDELYASRAALPVIIRVMQSDMISRRWLRVFIVVAFLAGGQQGFAANEPVSYKSKENGFSIRFPNSWKVKERVGGAAVQAVAPLQGKAPGRFRPCISVSVETVPQNMNLAEYAPRGIEKARKMMTDFTVYRTGRQTVSNTPARWWIISYQADTVTVKGFLFIVVKGSRAYMIISVAPFELYPSYKDLLADSAGSLAIEEPSPPAR